MNSHRKSLQVIEKKSLFIKIKNFFKKILEKNKTNYTSPNNCTMNEQNSKNSFFESIRCDDYENLLKIQDELEKRGITEKNVFELTKNLSEEQKQKLKALYKEQIKELELILKNYKNQIISARKKFIKNN